MRNRPTGLRYARAGLGVASTAGFVGVVAALGPFGSPELAGELAASSTEPASSGASVAKSLVTGEDFVIPSTLDEERSFDDAPAGTDRVLPPSVLARITEESPLPLTDGAPTVPVPTTSVDPLPATTAAPVAAAPATTVPSTTVPPTTVPSSTAQNIAPTSAAPTTAPPASAAPTTTAAPTSTTVVTTTLAPSTSTTTAAPPTTTIAVTTTTITTTTSTPTTTLPPLTGAS